jgi:hypothetical protein
MLSNNIMGCLWSNEEKKSPPLSTRAIYNLIFQKDDWIINNERSKSDSEVSYKISYSPESDLR